MNAGITMTLSITNISKSYGTNLRLDSERMDKNEKINYISSFTVHNAVAIRMQ